jgi:hypothetical protein
MRRAITLIVIGAVITTGCASSRTLKPEQFAQLKASQEIQVVHGRPPAFSVMTPERSTAGVVGAALGGVIGALVVGSIVTANAKSEGRQLVADYAIDDPVPVVEERVLAALIDRQALAKVNSIPAAVDDTDADALKSAFPDATVLAFRTDAWALNHLGSEYGVVYEASVRLVRTGDATELWKVTCGLDGKDFPKVSMAALKAEKGALLRLRLQKSAELCADKIIERMTPVTAGAEP